MNSAAHHWGRRLSAMGHRVKLIPQQYLKPYVKRNKNDRHDTDTIDEAASRQSMPTVDHRPRQTAISSHQRRPSDGRHHLGMVGAIISEWVRGTVGIRTS